MTAIWAILALAVLLGFLWITSRSSATRLGTALADGLYRLVSGSPRRHGSDAPPGGDASSEAISSLEASPRKFDVYVVNASTENRGASARPPGPGAAEPYVPGQPRSGERVSDLAARIQKKAEACSLQTESSSGPVVRDVLLVREDRRGGLSRITHVPDMPLPPGAVFRARGQSLKGASLDLATMILLGPQPASLTRSGYLCREGDAWAWFRIAPNAPDASPGMEEGRE